MATITQLRNAIKAKLETVAGIGVVHAFEPLAKTHGELKALYVSNGLLLGWHIRRVATAENSPAIGRYTIDHRWQVRGFMALSDDGTSELAFDLLIEDVRDAFRADETLGNLIGGTQIDSDIIGMQLQDHGPVMFCGVLCHGARLAYATRHIQVGV